MLIVWLSMLIGRVTILLRVIAVGSSVLLAIARLRGMLRIHLLAHIVHMRVCTILGRITTAYTKSSMSTRRKEQRAKLRSAKRSHGQAYRYHKMDHHIHSCNVLWEKPNWSEWKCRLEGSVLLKREYCGKKYRKKQEVPNTVLIWHGTMLMSTARTRHFAEFLQKNKGSRLQD
jgi:hypothetical protein